LWRDNNLGLNKSQQKILNGWVPKEPTLHAHQASADSQNSLMARWMARAIVLGAVASALLGVLGTQASLTHGVSGFVWFAFMVAVGPIAVAVAAVFAKRKEVQQRRTET
jgi:nicotinamide mononucleotide (NMN) deamidase PncC